MLPAQQTTYDALAVTVAVMATNRRDHLFITEWLRHSGFSDQDAADKLGTTRETVWRWANEQHRLNPQKIRRLADICGIEPGDFWHLPGIRSVDSILRGAPDDVREIAADIVSRLVRKKSST